MILSNIAIKRPVFTTMVIMTIIVFGIISFREIGIDLFPRVEFPVITIVSVLPGADPDTVESTVTDPIEEAVSNISAIKTLRSTSSDSVSQVVIEFELEKNVDVAYQEVLAKIGTVRSELPKDLEDPVVQKFDIDAAPIMAAVVSSESMQIRDLTHLADKTIKERLQRVRNVGEVKLVGGRDRKMWLWLNRSRLEGYGLTVQDVERALQTEHVEYPGGRVEQGPREYMVKTKAEFESADQFAGMVLTYVNGMPVCVRDIGRVEDGMEEERSMAKLNGNRAISLLVRRQSGTNTVEVANAVKAEIARLQKELSGRGIKIEIAQDLSRFIENSVNEVQFHLVYGGGLAILIVFFFLRNLRSMFISSLVIPTSIIGTFIVMNALGFTQNMMTLLALTLAIGLLIDDSIVVQENIMRHVEEGMPAKEAAAFATSEIALAVFATTLSVVAVFVPVAFMKGIIGRFFYQFGMAVTFAVLISMFVAFTLDPMLSSRILRKPKKTRLHDISERFFGKIDWVYEKLLAVALRRRWVVVVVAVGSFIAAGFIGKFLKWEFIPLEDQSEFNIKVKAPLGASLSTTDEILQRVHKQIQTQPWVDYTFATIGTDELQRVNEGGMYVKMIDKDKREISQMQAMEWARERLSNIPDAKISIEVVGRVSGGGHRASDLQIEIRGSNLDRLETIAGGIMSKMRAAGGYVDLDTTYEKGKPQINVYVKRDRAADMGVSPMSVASTVKALIGGDDVSKFRAEGDRYDVSVRLQEPYRDRPDDIELLTVRNNRGQLVRLQNVSWIKEEPGPVQIDRYNRTRQITILANLQRDKKVLGQAVEETSRFIQEANLPPGYTFGFSGMADTMKESFGYLFFALFLAVVMVYIVLASQFESFIHPFTIMLALPLSVVGALGVLVLSHMTMSIFTMIGIIMLMGLVTKNGILLVDFTNTLRRRDNMDRNQAILKAGPIRLRPILMTTFAMIFGMLPTALGTGSGSESRAPMAVAVIGGLTTSTLLTLVVVPVVYTLMDDLSHVGKWRVWNWLGKKSNN
ncbi:MAG: efflux RND transporter permease subunit [Phycisphaerae bacterium]